MPGSNNFQQFNPTKANGQEDDAAYTSDTLRSGGIPTGATLPHGLLNKAYYQWSTMTAALGEALKNKGYAVSDANFSTLVAVLSNLKTAADFLQSIAVVPYATSITFDAGVSAQFDLTLTGNVTTSAIVNTVEGQILVFLITQDGTGNHTFAWPTHINGVATTFNGTGNICPIANSTSIQMFVRRPNSVGSGVVTDAITQMLWITPAGLRLGAGPKIFSVNSNGTIPSAYSEVIEKVDASGGAVTRTAYTAVGFEGFKIGLKKTDATLNNVVFQPTGGQLVDGQASFSFGKGGAFLQVISDGANWIII